MSEVLAEGNIRKMRAELEHPVRYTLLFNEQEVTANDLLGQSIALSWNGLIHCIHCGRKTKKSFSQGYCFPCFRKLAQTDSCIVSPEKCHYDAGSCREPDWADTHCMTDHIVYLSYTSGVKVGITRASQIPTRWIDQGATQAMPWFRVSTRYQSGLLETVFKTHVADRTNWQAMLKGVGEGADLPAIGADLRAQCRDEIAALQQRFGLQAITELTDQAVVAIDYPVLEYPIKVKSFNLDKVPSAEGTLMGIKGQYLIFDTGVINLRKYGGYHLTLCKGAA